MISMQNSANTVDLNCNNSCKKGILNQAVGLMTE